MWFASKAFGAESLTAKNSQVLRSEVSQNVPKCPIQEKIFFGGWPWIEQSWRLVLEFPSRHVVFTPMTPRLLAELIDRHGPGLVLFARQWCTVPEDVVQEAFLKLVAQRTWPDDPAAWLYRVVRNASLDAAKMARRREKREATAKPDCWFVEPEIDGLDAEQAVQALGRLPDELRETIVARLWGGLTFEQIAAVSGISASSAYRRYEAGIASLQHALGESCQTR